MQGLRTPTRVLLLIAAYFMGGLLGKGAAFMNGDLALVWPPAGIALAAILIFGYRFLPGVIIGAFLFSTVDGKPLGFFTVSTAIGNCVGAMACTYMLRQSVRFQNSLERVRDVVAFILLASLFSTTINALFNVAGLHIGGGADFGQLGDALVIWWVPNAMGCLVVTPLLLTWAQCKPTKWNLLRVVEAAACWGGLIVGACLSFESWVGYGIQRYPLAYLPYPFLIWAALRFGVRGATLATFLVSAAAIQALLRGRGPFVTGSEQESMLLIGSYIAVLAIANLLLAAAASERAESERRYRAVVDDQTERICRFDLEGKLTFANEAYCKARGKKSDQEVLGTGFIPQLPVEDLEIPITRFLQLTKEHPILSYDARVVVDEHTGWEHCSVRAIFDEADRIVEFQMVSQDITERKEIEEALRASEEKIKAILVDGILTVQPDGMISSANPAAEKMFGYSNPLVGSRFEELLGTADRDEYASHLGELHGAAVVTKELHGQRANGKTFPIDLSVSELVVNGQPGYIVVVRDITSRRQVEEQLRHSQRMETVGHLAGGVAHDFNNILSIIIGHASLILAKHQVNEKAAQSIQQLVKASERGARLTRQLLMFSRRQVMQPKILDLNETVRELSKMLQRVLGGSITLEVETEAAPLELNADEGMLDQVLMNLAVNARDAMPEGGTLHISTGLCQISAAVLQTNPEAMPGEYAFIRVTDTGCGIPPEILPKIFEPFFTTKEVGKGTGLGLSIVYGIVKQHRGCVTVSSQPGVGTTFEVFIPLHRTEELIAPAREQQAVLAA